MTNNVRITKPRGRKPLADTADYSVGYRNIGNGPCVSVTVYNSDTTSLTVELPAVTIRKIIQTANEMGMI